MTLPPMIRNFAFVILSAAFLAACAQTQAEDPPASSSRVDMLESQVNQLQSDVSQIKSEMAATREAAEEARMAAEKMDQNYRKSLRK